MTARTITPSDTNTDQTLVTANGDIAGVIFHEPYAAQPGHRFEGKPYAVWTAVRGHLAERFATIEDAADAIAPQDNGSDRETETKAFRAELFAAPHLMPVNGGHVHYGTPESFGNTDIPACRQCHGYHRISYYRPVDLPVSCTNCISRYGTEA